jgi:hypothetical protein
MNAGEPFPYVLVTRGETIIPPSKRTNDYEVEKILIYYYPLSETKNKFYL